MFTAVDKALTALVMSVLFLLNTFTDINLGLSETTISTIIAGVAPILVWLIPNKTPAPVEPTQPPVA